MPAGQASIVEGLHGGPGSAGRLHLILLRIAGACLRTVGEPRATTWARRVTGVTAPLFGRQDWARGRVFGKRTIQVSLADRYWVPFLLAAPSYEPEVRRFLDLILRPDSIFVDCGANVGWWSIFATTIIADPTRIVAVEPSERAFASLLANRSANGESFECVRLAVSDVTADNLRLLTAENRPASSRLTTAGSAPSGYGASEPVASSRLDDLIDQRFPDQVGHIVLKLDVEGVEIPALEGLGRYLKALDAIIYEDHGNDRQSLVTRRLLDWGFRIFACTEPGGICRIEDVDQARALKPDLARGYNFAAVVEGSGAAAALNNEVIATCAS